jgi:acyl-coenzyme A synthetase/AMP-(fatty) acid ligase
MLEEYLMFLDFLMNTFIENKENDAIIWREKPYSYEWLIEMISRAKQNLKTNDIQFGDIVALRSDFNPFSIGYLIALIENGNIIVPISFAVKNIEEFCHIAEVQKVIVIENDTEKFYSRDTQPRHEINLKLKKIAHPGLILFSSGSTGKSKAAAHDFVPLLEKFKTPRKLLKTITFLLFDHIGGVNTVFYILSNAGTVISVEDRRPENICNVIEKYQVELLPTSPTFINMILMSRVYEKYDLGSLKLVTYGTEVMPEHTLKAFNKLFPYIKTKQTYGLSELGIMSSKSRSHDSLWVKIGGEDYETKIVDDILYIKARTAMLGYLNAPSPFDKEGWFNTQDKVEVDGEWIKILGRTTDMINVGGQKVYPAEVESILLGMDNIQEVSVFGKDNPIMGKVVAARINIIAEEKLSELKKRIRKYCKDKLEAFKIPVHIEISKEKQVSDRFKKVRN